MSYNKETGMYEGYIYKITNKINNKVYIGQTSVTVKVRYGSHLTEAKNEDGCDFHLYRAMRKYGVDNFVVDIIETLSCSIKEELKDVLNDKEMYYISKYNSTNPNYGYNMTKGGDTTSIYNMKPCDGYNKSGTLLFSCESVAEMSRITNVPSISIIHCCNGESTCRSDFVFRWKQEAFDKYNIETEYKNGVPVYCFLENGDFVQKFNTIGAAESKLGIHRNCIKSALLGKFLTNHYYFNTENVFDYVKPKKNRIPVDIYSYETKDFIGSYESITSALVDLGISGRNHNSIHRCLDGKNNHAYGYIWRYQGQPVDMYMPVNSRISLMKPVNVYDLNNNYLNTYMSLAETELATGVNRDMISNYIRGLCNSEKYGYRFYYANDPNQPDPTKVTDITAKELFNKQAA